MRDPKDIGDEHEDIISVGKPEANTCEFQVQLGRKYYGVSKKYGREERWDMMQVAPNRVLWAGTCEHVNIWVP